MSTIQLVSRIIETSSRLVTQPMDVHTLPLERFYPAWHESAEVGADDSHQVSAGMYFLSPPHLPTLLTTICERALEVRH